MKNYNKTFSKMFLSVISFIVILITIMSLSTYFYSSKVIKKELAQTNIAMLGQLKTATDNYVLRQAEDFIIKNFLEVPATSSWLSIFYDDMNNLQLYDYYQNLTQLLLTANFISDIHIYIPEKKMMMSTNGIRFLDPDRKLSALDIEKQEIFKRALEGEKWISTYLNSNGVNTITLLRTYTPDVRTSPKGIIAVDIDEKQVYNAADEISESKIQNVFIVDEKGQMISHPNKDILYEDITSEPYIQKIIHSKERECYFLDQVNGKNSLITYSKSEYNNWNYISVVDANTVFGVSNILLIFLLVMYLILLIIGIIGVYAISKNFYRPINKILDFIGTMTGERKREDDYAVITNTLNMLSNQVTDYKTILDDITPVMKNNFVLQLMYNKNLSEEDINKHMQLLEIDSNTAKTLVILSCTFNFTGLKSDEERFFEYGFIEYMFTFANDSRLVLCHSTLQNKVIVILGSCNEKSICLSSLLPDIEAGLHELDGVDYNICVSRYVNGMQNLCAEYDRLQIVENYNFVYGFNQVIYSEVIMNREKSISRLDETSFFQSLENRLKEKNLNETVFTINQTMKTLKDGAFSYQYVQNFLMRFITKIARVLRDEGLRPDDILEDKESLYEEYRQSKNIDQVFGFIQDLCIHLIQHENQQEKLYDVSVQVKEFISALPDNEIKEVTLSYISDRLYLSQSYISRIFKNETGMNFIDYLSDVKLNRSAKLLANRNMKVKDICEIIGYSNSNYYIKKFKDKFGVTPKQYQRDIK